MRRYQRWADLKFADWHNLEICGFVGAEWAQEFADLKFANFKVKFACPPLGGTNLV